MLDLEEVHAELAQVRAELQAVVSSMAYAYAAGSRCSMGGRTEKEREIVDRADRLWCRRRDLEAVIAEHRP